MYQGIPTGALRPRNDILGSALRLDDKLKFKNSPLYGTQNLLYNSFNYDNGRCRHELH